MMHTPWSEIAPAAVALLKEFEGFQATEYLCAAGVRTIGYGHVVRSCDTYTTPLSPAEAETLLAQDVQKFYGVLGRLIERPLAPHQTVALLSFVFNIGTMAFMRSTVRQVLNRYEDACVSAELQRWMYVKGRRCQGLWQRRQKESWLFDGYGWSSMPHATQEILEREGFLI